MRGERTVTRPVVGAVLLLSAATGFVLLLFLVRGEWRLLWRMDQAVADVLNGAVAGHGVVVRALRVVTDLGGSPALAWVTSVGVVWLLLRRQVRAALFVAVATVGAWILITVVKALVGRLRPVVDEPLEAPSGLSFPSGHALSSLVSYGVLLLVFLPVMNRTVRRAATAVAVVLVVLVGFTRIALGVHYLSDVVAGWLLGAVWLAVTAVAFRHWPHERLLGHPLPQTAEGGAVERSRVPSGLPVLGSARELRPVPERHAHALPRPLVAGAELAVAWLLIVGALYGLGVLVKGAGPGSGPAGWDRAVVRDLAEVRTPWLNHVAEGLRILGGSPGIIAGVAIVAPLAVAVTRSWRPLVLLAMALVGQTRSFSSSWHWWPALAPTCRTWPVTCRPRRASRPAMSPPPWLSRPVRRSSSSGQPGTPGGACSPWSWRWRSRRRWPWSGCTRAPTTPATCWLHCSWPGRGPRPAGGPLAPHPRTGQENRPP